MALNDTGGGKLPKHLRLFSKKEKTSLRPEADRKPSGSTKKSTTNLVGQRVDVNEAIEFDTSEDSVVSRSEIQFDPSVETPIISQQEVPVEKKASPDNQVFNQNVEKKLSQKREVSQKPKKSDNVESSKIAHKKDIVQKSISSAKSNTGNAVAAVPHALEKVIAIDKSEPRHDSILEPNPKSKSNNESKQVTKEITNEQVIPKAKISQEKILKPDVVPVPTPTKKLPAPKIRETHTKRSKPVKLPTENNSSLPHVFTGIMIACVMLTVAFLWPYLPFNREQVALNDPNTGGVIGEMVLGESDIDQIGDDLERDENGFAIIDEIQDETLGEQEELELVAPEEITPPVVISTTPQDQEPLVEPEQEITTEQIIDAVPIVKDETPVITITPDPVVYVAPSRTVGTWGLVNLNTETFDIDDEDDDVTQLYLEDVCKSVYRQNANAFDYCRETSKLKKSTSASLGTQRCDGGGSCRVGDTCLLWNSDEEDDGDLKSYTATYLCE